MFVQGQVYRRRNLHADYGGQRQGGISTPAGAGFILIFTSDSGEQYGYHDGWQDSGLFYYTGEGQSGDMTLSKGNKAIAEHVATGKDLHLFGQAQRAHVSYIGQFICSGHHTETTRGIDGNDRAAIVFELAPVAMFEEIEAPDTKLNESVEVDLTRLRELALEHSSKDSAAVARLARVRYRSAVVREYVLQRAAGICEGWRAPAPFLTATGRPYLESHHINRLSDGGPDHPRKIAAVCANCHRRAHHSADAATFNQQLLATVSLKEEGIGGLQLEFLA